MHRSGVLSALAISVLAVAPAMAADGGALTDAERAFLIEQMEMSKKVFRESAMRNGRSSRLQMFGACRSARSILCFRRLLYTIQRYSF
jgi:hypothetical protein